MKNITIGIPRGLLYYKYEYLWHTFFKEININIIISPKEIQLDNINENICFFIKKYIGHVSYLINKVDYILIPIDSSEKCPYLNYIYDIINNMFDTKIIYCDMNNVEEAFIEIGKQLGLSKSLSISSYKIAKKQQYKYDKLKYLIQEKKLKKDTVKVLIISNRYIYEDEYIKINYLDKFKNKNIDLFYYDLVNPDSYKDKKTYKKALYNNFLRLKKSINKIVFISTKPCVSNFYYFDDIINENNKIIINIDDNINQFINDLENIYE